jgi:hypothetical protein
LDRRGAPVKRRSGDEQQADAAADGERLQVATSAIASITCAINNGLLVVECDTASFQEGDSVTIHVADGKVRVHNETRDVTVAGASLPPIVQDLIRHGGLVPYLAARGSLD